MEKCNNLGSLTESLRNLFGTMQKLTLASIALFCCLCVSMAQATEINANKPIKALHPINYLALFEARQTMARDQRFVNEVAPKTQKDSLDLLCAPCLDFFNVLHDVIGDVSKLTKDTLTEALNSTCKYLKGSIPLIDQVCAVFGPEAIDALYYYLTEVADEIVPEHDCKLLFLCWGSSNDNVKIHRQVAEKRLEAILRDHKVQMN